MHLGWRVDEVVGRVIIVWLFSDLFLSVLLKISFSAESNHFQDKSREGGDSAPLPPAKWCREIFRPYVPADQIQRPRGQGLWEYLSRLGCGTDVSAGRHAIGIFENSSRWI